MGNSTPSLLTRLEAISLVKLLLGVVEEPEGDGPVVIRSLYSRRGSVGVVIASSSREPHLEAHYTKSEGPDRVLTLRQGQDIGRCQ